MYRIGVNDIIDVLSWIESNGTSGSLFTAGENDILAELYKSGNKELNNLAIWNAKGHSKTVALKLIYKSALVKYISKEKASKLLNRLRDAKYNGVEDDVIHREFDYIFLNGRKASDLDMSEVYRSIDKKYLKLINGGKPIGATYSDDLFKTVADVVNDIEFVDEITDEIRDNLKLSAVELFIKATNKFNHKEIIKEYADGNTLDEISKHSNVSKTRIGYIKKNFEDKYAELYVELIKELSSCESDVKNIIYNKDLVNVAEDVKNFIKIHRNLYLSDVDGYAINKDEFNKLEKLYAKINSCKAIYINNNYLEYPIVSDEVKFNDISELLRLQYTKIADGYYVDNNSFEDKSYLDSTDFRRCVCHAVANEVTMYSQAKLIRAFEEEYMKITGTESDTRWVTTVEYYRKNLDVPEVINESDLENIKNKLNELLEKYKGIYIAYKDLYDYSKETLEANGIDNFDKLKIFISKFMPDVKIGNHGFGLADDNGSVNNLGNYLKNKILADKKPINTDDYSIICSNINLYASSYWREAFGLIYLGNGKITCLEIMKLDEANDVLRSAEKLFDVSGVLTSAGSILLNTESKYPEFLKNNFIESVSELKKFLKVILGAGYGSDCTRLKYHFK